MTKEETGLVLKILRVAYPTFYTKMGGNYYADLVELWTTMFAEDDAAVVTAAVKDLILTHRGFPPEIADVKTRMREIVAAAEGKQTDEELWIILREAIADGQYGAKEQYEKLPPVLKRYCGSPSKLRDLSMTDYGTLDTVVHGQFLKTIPKLREREEFEKRLDPDMKRYIEATVKRVPDGIAPADRPENRLPWLSEPADESEL